MNKSSQRKEIIREIKKRYGRIRRERISKDIEPEFRKQLAKMEQQELKEVQSKQ